MAHCSTCTCGPLMWTPKEQQTLDFLLSGVKIEDLHVAMECSKHGVKERLRQMYRKAGITSGCKAIKLVTEEAYRRDPDLIPFIDGDRAQKLGERPAILAIQGKLHIERAHQKDNPRITGNPTLQSEDV